MGLLHVTATILLGTFAVIGLIGLRVKLSVGNGGGALVGLLVASSVYVLISGSYEHSWILLISSYTIPLAGFRVPVLRSILLLIGQLVTRTVRLGISDRRIFEGKLEGIIEMTDELDASPELKEKIVRKYKEELDNG